MINFQKLKKSRALVGLLLPFSLQPLAFHHHVLGGTAGVGTEVARLPFALAEIGLPTLDGEFALKLLAALCLALFLWNQIREARRKERPSPPPMPQPFVMTMKEQFVAKEEFDELKTDVHNRIKEMGAYVHEGLHGVRAELQVLTASGEEREGRLDAKLDEHWEKLSRDRSTTTARLYERIEATSEGLRQKSEASASKIHERVDGVAESIGHVRSDMQELRGGMKESQEQLKTISSLLMEKALHGTVKGGAR